MLRQQISWRCCSMPLLVGCYATYIDSVLHHAKLMVVDYATHVRIYLTALVLFVLGWLACLS
jgi:hypothetical protein